MSWMGLSEIPSNSYKRLEGLCVGLFVRYRSYDHPYEGPLLAFCLIEWKYV